MGIFDKVFKSERDIAKKEIVEVPWHPITEKEKVADLIQESEKKTILIFKHSTRCGISRMVLKNFESEWQLPESDNYKLYYLDLLQNRDVSNEVARVTGVDHESPQLIILKDGKVVHHDSHHSIKAETAKQYLDTVE